jgi:hypothetical protein
MPDHQLIDELALLSLVRNDPLYFLELPAEEALKSPDNRLGVFVQGAQHAMTVVQVSAS